MRKLTFVVILLMGLPTFLLGQPTKNIRIYYQNSTILKESYSVLVANESEKNGEYTYYFINQKIRLKGQYYFGKKDGKWEHYNDLGETRTVEYYNKGDKTGIWLDFMERGGVVKRYDWDKQESLPPYLPHIVIPYPIRGREEEIEGEVQIKFLLDENCAIKKAIPIKTLGKDFEQAVIEGYQTILKLSKKWEVEIEGCDVGERIFSITFALN